MKIKPIQAIRSVKLPTVKDVIHSLIYLPKKFATLFRAHIWLLLPLLATQLLQKCQDLVDDRFISSLGREALSIHNIQYSLFILGQEIGLAAATSALIFWNRKETKAKQGSLLSLHILLVLGLSLVASGVLYFFLGDIITYFKVPAELRRNASIYLTLGLVSLVVRAVYVPLNAMLIACDQRIRCTALAGGILLAKMGIGWVALNHFWDHQKTPDSLNSPMFVIGIGAIAVLGIGILLAFKWISSTVKGWEKMDFKTLAKVWPGELGIAAVSALSPLIYGFQVAQAKTSSPGFFVTYQLALHFTYMLTLPVLAGMQIAVRDASSEQSEEQATSSVGINFKPLHQSQWWPQFFYASVGPTAVLLCIAAFFAKPIFSLVYNYQIPKEHLSFLPLFYLGWVLWQFGSIYLIMLRASKKNGLATRNFVIAGLGVQVGLTQALLWFGWGTPFQLSVISFAYCATYFVLNRRAISEIQSKYYFLKARPEGIHLPKISLRKKKPVQVQPDPILPPNLEEPVVVKRRTIEPVLVELEEPV